MKGFFSKCLQYILSYRFFDILVISAALSQASTYLLAANVVSFIANIVHFKQNIRDWRFYVRMMSNALLVTSLFAAPGAVVLGMGLSTFGLVFGLVGFGILLLEPIVTGNYVGKQSTTQGNAYPPAPGQALQLAVQQAQQAPGVAPEPSPQDDEVNASPATAPEYK